MPVSKKRKKDGKPVHRSQPAVEEGHEHAATPEEKPSHPQARMGKPSNPFVAMQQRRASQRGR